ncbi:MAG: TrkH family potassium uptake protein [Nitrospirae bacterium]|nr:TrkH family potassium uptake protein [Nitrospirota bacterium]
MNIWAVSHHIGILLVGFCVLPAAGFIFALAKGEPTVARAFALTGALSAGIGGLLYLLSRRPAGNEPLRRREALALVPLAWLAGSLLAAVPFVASGHTGWVDAIFETVSGFTTTGASIFRDVEILPSGILLWRALLQWVGGIGIVVLFVAVFPGLGVGGKHMFLAEAPGPEQEGFLPRIRSTAIRVGWVYLAISVLGVFGLWMAGMGVFDAICHMMATLSTGGYSTRNASIGGFPGPWIPWVTILIMAAGGTNLGLFYRMATGAKRVFAGNSEFKWYLGILITASLLLAGDNWLKGHNDGFGSALTDGVFTAVSIQTTSGFATSDFHLWSSFGKCILLVLMFIGACSGSTGGGFKVLRLAVVVKAAFHETLRSLNPNKVTLVKIDDHGISPEIREAVLGVLVFYLGTVALSMLLVSAAGLDLESAISGTFATVGNVGPGFAVIGPASNYADVPVAAKLVFIVDMLLGRLEFYPLLVLFHPALWRK